LQDRLAAIREALRALALSVVAHAFSASFQDRFQNKQSVSGLSERPIVDLRYGAVGRSRACIATAVTFHGKRSIVVGVSGSVLVWNQKKPRLSSGCARVDE
jgi:RNase P/RNase MRP subunit POP5